MFTLKLKDVVVNSLKRYADKTLGAFNSTSCEYEYKNGNVCTAGAGMSRACLDFLQETENNGTAINDLCSDGLLNVDYIDEVETLQGLHDRWAAGSDFTMIKKEKQEAYKNKLDELHSRLSEFYPED